MQLGSSKSPRLAAHPLILLTALLVAAGAILFAGAGPGDAAVTQTGSYTVYSCTQGNGAGAWLPAYNDADPTFATGATCDNLTASLADTSSDLAGGSGAGYEFDPPAGTSIAGYSIDRTATLLLEPPVE